MYDAYRRTYLGRSEVFWAETLRAMEKHNVRNAQELRKRLQTADAADKKKPDLLEGRVLIVDSKNHKRVLGSIRRPSGTGPRLDGGDCWNVAVMPRPVSAMPFDPCADVALSVMHIRFSFLCVDWNVVLTSDAGLDLLMKIEDFRLPGETEEQAHVRSMYC